MVLLTPCFQNPSFQDGENTPFCCFKLPSLRKFARAATGNEYALPVAFGVSLVQPRLLELLLHTRSCTVFGENRERKTLYLLTELTRRSFHFFHL